MESSYREPSLSKDVRPTRTDVGVSSFFTQFKRGLTGGLIQRITKGGWRRAEEPIFTLSVILPTVRLFPYTKLQCGNGSKFRVEVVNDRPIGTCSRYWNDLEPQK